MSGIDDVVRPLPSRAEAKTSSTASRDRRPIFDRKPLARAQAMSEAIGPAAVAGWSIILLFFGVIGYWSFTAPLNGAVVAPAVVKVDGNRKSVQHLDGGIVKELRVKEGDNVRQGDTLILLDDAFARAEHDVLAQQYLVLRATEERLRTELSGGAELALPDELAGHADDPVLKSIWTGQVRQFQSRRAAVEGQRLVLKQRIEQLKAQIGGTQGQLRSYGTQIASVKKEMASLLPLLEQGLIPKPRYLQLERTATSLEGNVAEATSAIAKAQQSIGEQLQQTAQLDNDRLMEVTRDLRETQAKVLETRSRQVNARAVLDRVEIRSPYTGRVVGLNVFSIGGVIQRGERILDIVPERDSLLVEAQIGVDEIADVHPQMHADIHLTAYKQRVTPVVRGEVVQVSADRLADNKTGNPYYVAFVRIDERDLAGHANVKLYPGMPATVMIPTLERTAFDYLVGPLTMAFNRSFRQK